MRPAPPGVSAVCVCAAATECVTVCVVSRCVSQCVSVCVSVSVCLYVCVSVCVYMCQYFCSSIPRVERLTRAACEFSFRVPRLLMDFLIVSILLLQRFNSGPAQCWLAAAVQTVQVHHLHSSKSVKSVIPHPRPQSLVVVVASWPTPTD